MWSTGNAFDDGKATGGWIVSHFVEGGGGLRKSMDVEVKWGVHPAGESRQTWADDAARTTVLLMVSGRFSLILPAETVTLQKQGDYVIWGPGLSHSWRAEEDSVVVTVRWPVIPPKPV